MKVQRPSRSHWSSALGVLTTVMLAAAASAPKAAQPSGVVTDWSHRHLVFANPGTYADMLDQRVSQDRWLRWLEVQKNPRLRLQQLKRATASREAATGQNTAWSEVASRLESFWFGRGPAPVNPRRPRVPPPTGPQIHRDWSNVMGGGSGNTARGVGNERVFPAKFSFDPSSKNCATDFVVYTTSAAGASSTGTLFQTTGTFTGQASDGDTFTLSNALYNPDQVLTLTAGAVDLDRLFSRNTPSATGLANAINRNGGMVGLTATSSGNVVTVNSITAQVPNAAIILAETSATFSWGTETAGTAAPGQPTIFALNQLYKDSVANGGCQTATQPVPATYWSYNTGTGAVADLSPSLSFFDNGAQVAFTQRVGTAASLVLLKWSSTVSVGTIGQPIAPTSVTPANYRTCIAPCMTVFALGANNSNSSPYIDYASDTLYLGDDGEIGRAHV